MVTVNSLPFVVITAVFVFWVLFVAWCCLQRRRAKWSQRRLSYKQDAMNLFRFDGKP